MFVSLALVVLVHSRKADIARVHCVGVPRTGLIIQAWHVNDPLA